MPAAWIASSYHATLLLKLPATEAVDAISEDVVAKSWIAAGILRAVFNEPAPEGTAIVYDGYCEVAAIESAAQVDVDGAAELHDFEAAEEGTTQGAPEVEEPSVQVGHVPGKVIQNFVLVKERGRPRKTNSTRDEIVLAHRQKLSTMKRKRTPATTSIMAFIKKRKVDDLD